MPKHQSETPEDRDHVKWSAIEEAAELISEARYDDALIELKRVLDGDAQNPYAFNLLGNVLFEMSRFEPARDAYRAAVLLAPDFLGARVALSHTLRRLKDFPGAEREARLALTQFPKDGDARFALGLAQAALGKRKEATSSLQGMLKDNPEFETSVEVRGILEMLGIGPEDEPVEFEDL